MFKNNNYNRILYIFSIISILLGIIIFIFGNKMYNTYKNKKSHYISTNATVIAYDSKETYDTDTGGYHTVYGTIAEYEVNGTFYKIYPNSYKRPKNILPKLGSIVNIRYNPEAPSDAVWENNSTSSSLLIFGSLFVLVGFLFIIISIIQKNKKLHNVSDKNITGIIFLFAIIFILFITIFIFL